MSPLRPRLYVVMGIYAGLGISQQLREVFRAAFRPRCSDLSARVTEVSGGCVARSYETRGVGRALWSGLDGMPRLPSLWARSRSCASVRRPATTTETEQGVPRCRSSEELRRHRPPSQQTGELVTEWPKSEINPLSWGPAAWTLLKVK